MLPDQKKQLNYNMKKLKKKVEETLLLIQLLLIGFMASIVTFDLKATPLILAVLGVIYLIYLIIKKWGRSYE